MTPITEQLRRSLSDMAIGMVLDLPIGNLTLEAAGKFVEQQAAFRKRRYAWREGIKGILVTRGWNTTFKNQYGLEKLKVGETCLINRGAPAHQSIRVTASVARRDCGRVFTCRAVAEGMLVTRGEDLPLPSGEELYGGILHIVDPADYLKPTKRETDAPSGSPDSFRAPTAYRYPIDALAVGESCFVSLAQQPLIANLRSYCAYHGGKLGRRFTVKAEGGFSEGGGHRVTRTA